MKGIQNNELQLRCARQDIRLQSDLYLHCHTILFFTFTVIPFYS